MRSSRRRYYPAVGCSPPCDDGGMADGTTAVIWDSKLLTYDLGDHPLDPVRVELTMALARELGVLDRERVRMVTPTPADDAALTRVHRPGVPRCGTRWRPSDPFFSGWGLNTSDNPVFPGMHEASARVAGATLAAAEAVVARRRPTRAVNFAGGLHHAMADARVRLLRLQRPRGGHRARCSTLGRAAGRLRRRRRAPRRRRAGRVLRRPAGADRSACTSRR